MYKGSWQARVNLIYIGIFLTSLTIWLFVLYPIFVLADTDECSCWQKKQAKVTAYVPKSPKYGKYNDGKTALGDNAFKLDGVAVAPDAIPYRSKIFIPSVGVKESDDTGAAMRKAWKEGNLHIDLRVKNLEKAREWGVKELTVFVKRCE